MNNTESNRIRTVPTRVTHSFVIGERLEYNNLIWTVKKIQSGFIILDGSVAKSQRMGLMRAWELIENGGLKLLP